MLSLNRIKQKANYTWRIGATGLAFLGFGVGGVVIGSVVAPVLNLTTRQSELRQQRARQVIRYSFKGFVGSLQKMGVMTYNIDGLEKLQQSKQELIIANHPTLLDVVCLIGLMEEANCVVKQALWSNPFTKGPVQNAGYILNTGSEKFIHDCVSRLKQDKKASLLIFPEGTRTAQGQLLNEFQRGAANIAIRANVPIRPILIRCTPSTLTKNEKWYHIPSKPFHIDIQVLETIQVDDLLEDTSVSPKHVRQLNQKLQQFFNQALLKRVNEDEQSC